MDVDALRAATPGCAHRTHLNNAGAALMTTRTIEAMTAHLDLEARIGGYEAAAAAQPQIQQVYDHIAALVGGRADQVALFENSTHAWNAAFYSIPLRPGDRIVTGRNEYGSSVLAYVQVAERTGAEIVVAPDDASGQIDLDALADLVDERTRLVGLTWVPTAGGLVNPAAEVGRIARAAGALYLLDATQAVGQFPIDVAQLGCDVLTGTGRKFLRGPRGTGFLWTGERALAELEPHVVEIRSAEWDGERSFAGADGALRCETLENSYLNVVGLGSAVEQALEIGLEEIGTRTRELGAALRGQLAATPGVAVHDLGTEHCAIVTASVEGHPADEVAAALAAAGINVSITVPGHNQLDLRGLHPLVRLSPHYYNTEDELRRCVEVVAGM